MTKTVTKSYQIVHVNTYNNDFFFFFRDADSSAASFVSRFLDFLPSLSFDPENADIANCKTVIEEHKLLFTWSFTWCGHTRRCVDISLMQPSSLTNHQ